MDFDSLHVETSASSEATPIVAPKDLPRNVLAFAADASLVPPEVHQANGKRYLPEDEKELLKQDPEAAFVQLDALFVKAQKVLGVKLVRIPYFEIGGGELRSEWRAIEFDDAISLETLRGRLVMYATEDARFRGAYNLKAKEGLDPAYRLYDEKKGDGLELLTRNPIVLAHGRRVTPDDVKYRRSRKDVPVNIDFGKPIVLPGAPETRPIRQEFAGEPRTYEGRIEISKRSSPTRFLFRADKGRKLIPIKYEDRFRPAVLAAHEHMRCVKCTVRPTLWKTAGVVMESGNWLVAIHG